MALKNIRELVGTADYARKVFEKVFDQDIHRLVSVSDVWKDRVPPKPLKWTTMNKNRSKTTIAQGIERDHQVWTTQQAFNVFIDAYASPSCIRLKIRCQALGKRLADGAESLEFDKDDDVMMDFVSASTTLRASIFGITTDSRFQNKVRL